MTQMITDFNAFLNGAKKAVRDLNDLKQREEQLRQQEIRLEKDVEAEEKAVQDAISLTVKKRREEVNGSYDAEMNKLQEKLKKVKGKREKARNQEMQGRIREETQELHEANRGLSVQMKTLFKKDRVPGFCNSTVYYALYFPKGIREFFTFLFMFLLCFWAVPCGAYLLIPERRPLYLAGIYILSILVFGGIYIAVGNKTRGKHLEALREGRRIRNQIQANRKKIRLITNTIKKDKNETVYDLEKFDDEISRLNQELEDVAVQKKEALTAFENVTKTIIIDEITGNSKEKIERIKNDCEQTSKELVEVEKAVKEKKIYITDTYESYIGREFLDEDRLEELRKIIEDKKAGNISEAIEIYKETAGK